MSLAASFMLAATIGTAAPAPQGPDPGVAQLIALNLPLAAAVTGGILGIRNAVPESLVGHLLSSAGLAYIVWAPLQASGHLYAGDPLRALGIGSGAYVATGGGLLTGLVGGVALGGQFPGTPSYQVWINGAMLGAVAGTAAFHGFAVYDAGETARAQRARYNRAP